MKRRYLPFHAARKFVRNLGLKDRQDWRLWSLSRFRPENIPYSPSRVYAEHWISFTDWLRPSTQSQNVRLFPKRSNKSKSSKRLVIAWSLADSVTPEVSSSPRVGADAPSKRSDGPRSPRQNLPRSPRSPRQNLSRSPRSPRQNLSRSPRSPRENFSRGPLSRLKQPGAHSTDDDDSNEWLRGWTAATTEALPELQELEQVCW